MTRFVFLLLLLAGCEVRCEMTSTYMPSDAQLAEVDPVCHPFPTPAEAP